MPDLAVLIPTRGRPKNILKVIDAWDFTNAWDAADMIVIADADDPEIMGYRAIVSELSRSGLMLVEMPTWQPMVHKLNAIARQMADARPYFAIGFAGDDHLPQTINWARRYLAVLGELKTGMVYGDDGYQGAKLSTEWAVTADVVRELNRMVPADVEHMYCDNAIMEMFGESGALRHLPEVRIEHMHPVVGKAETDEQYDRVNGRAQFSRDRRAYQSWASAEKGRQVKIIQEMRKGLPRVAAPKAAEITTKKKGSTMTRMPFPRFFKRVRGATPDEIAMTLADFARQVPPDQEIVELGVFQGRTALIMAWGAQQGMGAHVTAIDPWDLPGNVYDPPFTDEGSRSWARYNVMSLGYSNHVTLRQAFSVDAASAWTGPEVGLLFVDGDHTKEGARGDIEVWAPLLADGALIAVDDYDHPDWPEVREAVDELVAEEFLEPVQIFHDRLAVTRLKIKVATAGDLLPEVPPDMYAEDAQPITAITSEGVATVDSDGSTWMEPLEDLTLPDLKQIAKTQGIVLGARKDRKDLIIEAIRNGA